MYVAPSNCAEAIRRVTLDVDPCISQTETLHNLLWYCERQTPSSRAPVEQLGVMAAALCTRFLELQLFDTSPWDPASFAGVTVLISACTLLAR